MINNLDFITASQLAATSTPMAKSANKRARVGSNYCPKCEKALTDESNCMACSVCELNFCVTCTGISPILLTALIEDTSHNFKWTCNGCKQNFPCMTGLSQQLKSIETKTQSQISSLELKVEKIQVDMGQKVKTEVNQIRGELADSIKKDIKESLQDDIRKELYEIEDQKRRALNLVIFNLYESKSTTSAQRQDHDTHHFTTLCNKIGVNDVDITSIFRLGNPKKDVHRPLKVVLNNKKQRKTILDNSSKIRLLAGTVYEKCIIVKDLTTKQRKANKERRENQKKGKTPKKVTNQESNPAYNEETIHPSPENAVNSDACMATIENVTNMNISNIQSNNQTTYSQYYSQPLLTEMQQPVKFIDMLNDTNGIGDETVIGGLATCPLESADGHNTNPTK